MHLKIKNVHFTYVNLLADFFVNQSGDRSRPVDSDLVRIDNKNGQFSTTEAEGVPLIDQLGCRIA